MNARAEELMREVRQRLQTAVEFEAQGQHELALVAEAIAANKLDHALFLTRPDANRRAVA